MKQIDILFLIKTLFFSLSNSEDTNLMINTIQAISKVYHFGFYVFLDSHEKAQKLHEENLMKTLHTSIKFSTIVDIPIDDFDKYDEKIRDVAQWKRSNIEMKGLAIFNSESDTSWKKFVKLSEKINFGGKDIWLIFFNGTNESLKNHLKSATLPFNSQLIVAVMESSNYVSFKAPYKVAESFPLRIKDVGNYSDVDGLNLPIIDVAMTRQDMEGLLLKTGSWNYPPVTMVNYTGGGKFSVTGYLPDIYNELSERLNFTYDYLLAKDNTSGAMLPNGTWTGLMGMLINKEIDVAVIQFSMTIERTDYIDFSAPIISTRNQIFYLDVGNQLNWGNLFRPFRKEVWLVILLWLVAISVSLAFFYTIGCSHKIEKNVYKHEYTVLGCFLIAFRALVNQGSDLTPESLPTRTVFYSAYLSMAVILPAYSAALISYLTIQTPYKPFDSMETMLERRSHKLAVSVDTADYTYFKKSTDPTLQKIFRKLILPLEKEGTLPNNPKEGIEMACLNEDIAFFGNYLSGVMYADKYFRQHKCRVISLEKQLLNVEESLGFQKGSPYAPMINLELQKMILTGLKRRFEKEVYSRRKEKHDSSAFEEINIRHVVQIHCFLIGGFALSLLFFMLEFFFSNRRRNGEVKVEKNCN